MERVLGFLNTVLLLHPGPFLITYNITSVNFLPYVYVPSFISDSGSYLCVDNI